MRVLLLTCCALALVAADLPTPKQVYDRVMGNGNLRNTTGEQFTWHMAAGAHDFLEGFQATGKTDAEWLVQAQRYYDWCIETAVSNDPDGFPGTIGAGIGEDIDQASTTTEADTLVGDANLCWPLVHFAELVKADPALHERFGATADRYIELATRMVWEKWNHRGCYYEDARGFGSYRTHEKCLAKGDRTTWIDRRDVISDNLNKHYKAGVVILGLWRITGKTEYADRVFAVFARAKAMFRYLPEGDRIVWNFWMPHGPYDITGSTPKSWVGVHPSRAGYQSFEAGAFLEVYDSGLVFTQQDMERIVRTNVWMIQNGNRSADGTSDAGTLWAALAGLDPTLKAAAAKGDAKNPLRALYREKVTCARSGYERKLVKDPKQIRVADIPVQPGAKLSLAQPVPDRLEIANDDRIRLLARVMTGGKLTCELLDAKGTVLGTLHEESIDPKAGAFSAPRWDGTNPKTGTKDPGTYVLRWTLDGESREWPVSVVVGTKKSGGADRDVLASGASISQDFEGDLDPRWKLEGGAEVAGDQVHGGAKALRIGRRQSASLRFGDQDDLKVRITFWAFDNGAKHGKKGAEGTALCLRDANGDLFAIRQMWRGYLGGDGDVVWVNTGENQWFTPHPSGLGRQPGWNHWTFDLTGDQPIIERDGKRLEASRLTPAKYAPTGAVGLHFIGPSDPRDGDLWIDDLVIERP